MSANSKIEWTDATWNPIAGCKAVSPGCDNCYAAREVSGRLSGQMTYRNLARDGVFTGEIRFLEDRLEQPLHWRDPKRVFVNSMSDLFHPDVPMEFIGRVFDVMGLARQHTFQILTKRPQRMAGVIDMLGAARCIWSNVQVGTSIEANPYCFRADHLRLTGATCRFLSLEPLLGPLPDLHLGGIDWVIVGGESGPNARPMHPDWARDVRDRCVAAGVPFFFKQWGEWAPINALGDDIPRPGMTSPRPMRTYVFQDSEIVVRAGRKQAGRQLDGRTWDEYPR